MQSSSHTGRAVEPHPWRSLRAPLPLQGLVKHQCWSEDRAAWSAGPEARCAGWTVKDSFSSLLASPDELILPVTEACSNEEMALWIFYFLSLIQRIGPV